VKQIKKKNSIHASYIYAIYKNQPVLYCSYCKKVFTESEINNAEIDLHTCSNCGAIMDGSEKNN